MKNCIVTGGAGFIGSNLSQKLIELGHKVTVIDNLSTGIESNLKKVKEKINFKKLDISKIKDLDQVSFQDVDWVFHLAGIADIVPSIQNPDKYFMSNVLGTLNVLQKSKSVKVKKFIYAASASCYGIPDNFPTKESEKIKPEYPYALTKNIAEQLVMHWAKIYDMPNISLRFFNAYGPNSRTTGAYGAMFGVFLAQKLNNKPLTIVGDGKQTRDFIHVSDLVEAVIKIADSKKNNEIYNLASGKETSVNYIAKIIGGETIKIPKRPGEPDITFAEIKRITKKTNWRPKHNIEEMCRDGWRWHNMNPNGYK